MRSLVIVVGVVLLIGSFTRNVFAADRFVTGSVSVETPVGQAPERPQDNSPSVLGDLKLHNVVPHLNLFADGQLQWKKGLPYSTENRARVGLEYELYAGVSLYGYGERRFDEDANRYMVGVKYQFRSPKF